ncbi:hypothetical protein Tco_0586268 [Tanacetum coccineum]
MFLMTLPHNCTYGEAIASHIDQLEGPSWAAIRLVLPLITALSLSRLEGEIWKRKTEVLVFGRRATTRCKNGLRTGVVIGQDLTEFERVRYFDEQEGLHLVPLSLGMYQVDAILRIHGVDMPHKFVVLAKDGKLVDVLGIQDVPSLIDRGGSFSSLIGLDPSIENGKKNKLNSKQLDHWGH